MHFIPLRYTTVSKWACLREVCGHDVLSINRPGTLDAIGLIDRLLVDRSEQSLQPGRAAAIATADRDELLLAIYRMTYGTRIQSTLNCQVCEAPFDLDFNLDQLFAFLRNTEQELEVMVQEDGSFRLPDGSRFRLPTGEDEQRLLGLTADRAGQLLLQRCLLDGDAPAEAALVQQAMQQVAPVFETELQACCPECDKEQQIRFDMQSYLLNALLLEKAQLPLEVHRLAMSYGWSQHEILELPRSLRRRYVSLIMTESALN
ncbi:MAG: hypothetical protein AAGG75_03225 [Bacteroidota bacterium]